MNKLFAYGTGNNVVGIDHKTWDESITSGATPFIITTATTVSGYTDISSIINWDNFGRVIGETYVSIRTEIKDIYDADGLLWSNYSTSTKRILAKYFIVGKTERNEVLSEDDQINYGILLEASLLEKENVIRVGIDIASDDNPPTMTNDFSASTISATTYYGDGSNLTGISGGGGSINHTMNVTFNGIYSTTSQSFSQIPEQITLPLKEDVLSGATSMKCKVLLSYDITGRNSAGEMDIWNYTDSLSIGASTTALTDTGGWHYTTTDWFDVTEGKTYRIRARRVGGSGNNAVQTEGAVFILKYE